MTKYTPDFKHKVVTHYLSGHSGHQRVADKFAIPKICLRTWLNAYEKQGIKGLQPYKRVVSNQFKCKVVEYMIRHQLSYTDTGKYFDIPFSNVAAWSKIYVNQGKQALLNSRQGRQSTMKKSYLPVKPDKQKTHAELLDELEYLRAENAYLKKLDALIQQQDQIVQHLKRKPSKS